VFPSLIESRRLLSPSSATRNGNSFDSQARVCPGVRPGQSCLLQKSSRCPDATDFLISLWRSSALVRQPSAARSALAARNSPFCSKSQSGSTLRKFCSLAPPRRASKLGVSDTVGLQCINGEHRLHLHFIDVHYFFSHFTFFFFWGTLWRYISPAQLRLPLLESWASMSDGFIRRIKGSFCDKVICTAPNSDRSRSPILGSKIADEPLSPGPRSDSEPRGPTGLFGSIDKEQLLLGPSRRGQTGPACRNVKNSCFRVAKGGKPVGGGGEGGGGGGGSKSPGRRTVLCGTKSSN